MKKIISVYTLFIKNKFKYYTADLLLLVILSISTALVMSNMNWSTNPYGMFALMKYILMFIFLFCYISMICINVINDTKTSNYEYTLCRLNISRRYIFIIEILAATSWFFVFALTESFAVYLSICIMFKTNISNAGLNVISLSIITDKFFHGIMPGTSTMVWVRNLTIIFAAGISCVSWKESKKYEHKHTRYIILIILLPVLILFPSRDTNMGFLYAIGIESGLMNSIFEVGLLILLTLLCLDAANFFSVDRRNIHAYGK